MRSISLCLVFPLGLGTARLPIVRNGSFVESEADVQVMGSNRAAGWPRCERTKRSPLLTRRRMVSAFLRNSNIVTVFMRHLYVEVEQMASWFLRQWFEAARRR